MARQTLFLTGRLAEPSLRRTLGAIDTLDFDYEVRDLGLQVAGLMTASMIERRLKEIDCERIVVPGLCSGDLDALADRIGVPVEKGPVDLKDLPEFYGTTAKRRSLDTYEIEIFAEIVDAPDRSVDAIVERAHYYRDSGADVIDIGCLPDRDFPHLEAAIERLKALGFRVSVDSLDDNELLRGGRAGADYLLSLRESTLWIADEVDATPILIPESTDDMASLYRAIERLQATGRSFYADAILDPILFGTATSIVRYHELATRYPEAPIFMGTGNVTELLDAETTGVGAVLCGIAAELGVRAVLTTEVADHAQTVVRETDLARRIVYAAKADNALAKGYDPGLLTTHEKKPFPSSQKEVAEIAAQVRDPSYRIQVTSEGISLYNRDGHFTESGPFDLFPHINVDGDVGHAFYLGVELERAKIAFDLGKRYVQDRPLDWGRAGPAPSFDPAAHEYAKPGTTRSKQKGEANSSENSISSSPADSRSRADSQSRTDSSSRGDNGDNGDNGDSR